MGHKFSINSQPFVPILFYRSYIAACSEQSRLATKTKRSRLHDGEFGS